ncbi:sulfatase-like hydrolase/transferase [Labilibaculum antarcticum]|uniref:Sulfatase n=1 Tax=Labilibaculum antarcticum TaxID=1717717 RepID=A0A1Y1CEQ0_9BACT|nr:sulfatase-like hydrolase/transferase [Labilibaculum antarcticum]BAX78805.1 sulfatase [Labilibaculum antarcticum]
MNKILSFLAILLLALLFFSFKVPEKESKNQPNIIFIYSDDQRQDATGFNGNEIIITPELDRFAQEGIRFLNANVVFALCSPSRAALLTGRYGSANGVLHLNSDLNENEITIASYLKEAGYNTAMSGKWHLGTKPEEAGFDFYCYFKGNGAYYGRSIFDMGKKVNPEIHCDEYCVNRSIDFLKDAASKDQPFFLFHNTQLPHMNGKLIWNAKQETLDKYKQEEMPVSTTRLDNLNNKPDYLKTVRNCTKSKDYGYPDSVAIQKHTKEYYSVITEMDDALGRLFKTIEELDLMENTYIFFMSDNGWMLGEHGFTSKVLPYQPCSSVPLFVVGPDIKPGLNNNLVLNIDMAPTIMELAGIESSSAIHGKSIAGILSGEKLSIRDAFVYEGLGNYGGTLPNLTVVSKEYRYIVTYEDESLKKVVFRELYNQQYDVDEMDNLIEKSSYKKVIKELQKWIDKHKEEVLGIQ